MTTGITNRLASLVLVIFLCFPAVSSAGSISTFPDVKSMIDAFNDYSTSNGTFVVLKSKPLHIQLSPQVVKGDLPEVIMEQVNRALMYGIYRSFIHTQIKDITVTAVPIEINFRNKNSTLLSKYKKTISISRNKALALVKKYINAASFSDLVTDAKIGTIVIHDQWTKDFKRIYYNDQGSPGLNRFVSELSK